MDLGAVVEVAIGLIFVWIVLSLATIQIQEWISIRLDRRAKDLELSLHEMLANTNLKSQFYDHPIIRCLTARKRKKPSTVPAWFYTNPLVRGFTREKRKLPSYIPARTFAQAIFDITMTAGTESSLIQQGILKIRDDFQQKLEKAQEKPKNQAVIDALNIAVRRKHKFSIPLLNATTGKGKRVVLITMHRRENWGAPMEGAARAIKRLAERYDDHSFIFPVHLNPMVRDIVFPILQLTPNAFLV